MSLTAQHDLAIEFALVLVVLEPKRHEPIPFAAQVSYVFSINERE